MPKTKPRADVPALSKSLRITDVKRTRKTIFVAWTVNDEVHDVTSRDNPLSSFDKALDALPPLVCEICGLPKEYAEGMRANGIYISEPGGNEAVTIVATKTLPDNNRPFNIATPLRLTDEPKKPGGANPPLSDQQCALINKVIAEAGKYIRGERAQGQIQFEEEHPEKAEATEPLPLGDDKK